MRDDNRWSFGAVFMTVVAFYALGFLVFLLKELWR